MGIVERALAELDGSDFEAVRDHSATLRATIQSLQADNAALREVVEELVNYGDKHDSWCAVGPLHNCTCDLHALKSKARALIGKEQS